MAADTVIQEREVESFDRIDMRAFGDLEIALGETPALTLEGDREVLDKIESRVEGGRLVIEFGRDWLERLVGGVRMLGGPAPRYRVTVPSLRAIALAGRGSVRADGLAGEELELAVSGLGEAHLGGLAVGELRIAVSGRGEVELTGEAAAARVTISGSGHVDGGELRTRESNVRISGHGEVELAVEERLDVQVAGWGRVVYRGDPRVTQQIAGGGSVTRRDD